VICAVRSEPSDDGLVGDSGKLHMTLANAYQVEDLPVDLPGALCKDIGFEVDLMLFSEVWTSESSEQGKKVRAGDGEV